jgi:ABC-type arginine/histidine transport system permease subunit
MGLLRLQRHNDLPLHHQEHTIYDGVVTFQVMVDWKWLWLSSDYPAITLAQVINNCFKSPIVVGER